MGGGGRAHCRPVINDGAAVDGQLNVRLRAVTDIEDGIVFEVHDGGFDSVEGGAGARKNGPAGSKSAVAAGLASVHGFVRNVPRAAVNDERWFHQESIAEKKENGK